MLKRKTLRTGFVASLLVCAVGFSACSSDDDDGGGSTELNEDLVTLSVMLDSTQTVPGSTGAEDATADGDISVDTATGAIAGTVTVSNLTGPATMVHVHQGAAGETGDVLVGFVANDDATVWTIPDGATLDAVGIQDFEDGNLYLNVHTEANPAGEVRGQLVDGNPAPAEGSVTISFVNMSASQPMTPPVVALHTDASNPDGGVDIFQMGETASAAVAAIAENGNNDPLVDVLTDEVTAGTVSDFGVAAPEAGGPLTPGATSTITLMPESADQVLSIVAMVVCTNDGFTGIDSVPLADAEGTFLADIYDAGSEVNTVMLNYWVPPCSQGEPSENLHTDEGGVITPHEGQTGSEIPVNATTAIYDFEAGAQLLEVTVTQN